ncbi:MAG: hypothetical protein ABI120_17740 [Gemmatimonadaceae bacterium]
MRKIVAISALTVLAAGSVAAIVIMTRTPGGTMTADLERDLNLATSVQTTRTGIVSAIEQGRNGAPSGTSKGARMVVPTRKRAPGAAPAPTIAEVAIAPAEVNPEPALSADVSAPTSAAATTAIAVVAATAPDPDATIDMPGGPSAGTSSEGVHNTGNTGRGAEGNRGGTMGRIGGMIGVVLRGGSAGDDHCEPPGRGRNGNPIGGAVGAIGAIGGILVGGGGMPTGSLPGGNRGGRRW